VELLERGTRLVFESALRSRTSGVPSETLRDVTFRQAPVGM
jgi:hypothetical protein